MTFGFFSASPSSKSFLNLICPKFHCFRSNLCYSLIIQPPSFSLYLYVEASCLASNHKNNYNVIKELDCLRYHSIGFATMTKMIELECLTSSLRMSRRALEVVTPPPSNQMQSPSAPQNSAVLFFFLGAIAVLTIVLILLVLFRKFIKTSKLMKLIAPTKMQQGSKEIFSGNLRTISHFDFETLKKVTKNFHPGNLLGSGGFGPVYRGKLSDGRLIAVKKLSLDKSQQGETEFLAEVRLITSIQHKNLVRLLGCCSDGSQRLLVYEYMKNRSLDLLVYGNSDQFLNWNTRFQIILGIARGLQYLHEDSNLRIVHRDIKASNILLDDKFHARIGDFGLARFFPEDQLYLSTQFAGTLGYTAPEYAIRGELSEKADIYSYGVLVLEIISCRKNTDLTLPSEMQYLPEYAWKLYERSRVIDLVDPKMLEDGIVEKDVLQAISVAFLCLQPHANLRPPMSEVVSMLTCKVEMIGTPLKPAFLERRHKKYENISWDTISEAFPSSVPTDSPSIPKMPN